MSTATASGSPAGVASPRQHSGRLVLAIILALTFAAYARTLGFEFVYDDTPQIVENTYIRSWDFVPRYFTEHVWSYAFPNDPGSYYRPLFLLWLRVHYALFGDAPAMWHLSVVLLHVLATALVYLLGRRLFPENNFVPLSAALLFGIHPVHIESVAWVSGLVDPLVAVLFLGSLLAYLRHQGSPADQPGRGRLSLAVSLVLCALALLTKEIAVVLPVFIFAHGWIHSPPGAAASEGFTARLRRGLQQSWPYFVLTAVYLAARSVVLDGLGHSMVNLDASTIVLTWPSMLWSYARLLLWPFGLSAFYDAPYVRTPALGTFWLPLVAVAAIGAGVVVWTRRHSRLALLAAWLALPLLPLLHLEAFQQREFIHDRYLYLPSVAFCLLLAAGLHQLREAARQRPGLAALPAVAVLVLGVVWTAATVRQSGYWRDDFTLFSRGVEAAPDNNLALNNLATVLEKRGEMAGARKMYEAILARQPNHWLAVYNLGQVQYRALELDAAEKNLTRSIALNPRFPEAHLYLGLVRLRQNRLDEARQSIEQATQLNPRARGFHFALGVVHRQQGNLRAALDAFKKELENDPSQAAAVAQILAVESQMRAQPAAPAKPE